MREAKIEELAKKLEALRQRERRRGAPDDSESEEEPYALGPPLDPATVAAVEERYNVTLPDDYKAFLTKLGNGGAGPSYYGCYGLEEAFAESRKTIYGFDEPFDPPTSTDDLVGEAAPGMLLVGYEGCAYYTGLVLTGPEAGSVWSFVEVRPGWIPMPDPADTLLREDGTPFVFDDDYGDWYDTMLLPINRHLRISYTRWYEQWIDNLLEPPSPVGHA